MFYKKKLPLALLISLVTMLTMHLLAPINLHSADSSTTEDTNTVNKKRAVDVADIEACPENGPLLPEDTPYWSDKMEDYKKPLNLKFVSEKPLSDVCCAPTNFEKKTFGYVQPPPYTDKTKNPCWYDGKRLRCVPYFYIIGATKSGTTDIFQRLLAHPDVESTRREVHWFSRLRTLGAELRWYSGVFNSVAKAMNDQIQQEGSSKKIIGEATLDYLSDVHLWQHLTGNQGCAEPRIIIANHLRYMVPDARIIISLREPGDRLLSTYLYTAAARERLKDPSTQKLHEQIMRAVPAYKDCFKQLPVRACVYNRTLAKTYPVDLATGVYAAFVEDWLRIFPRNQIFVVKYEDYSKDTTRTIKDLFKFLGLRALTDSEFEKIAAIPPATQNVYYSIGPMQNRTAKLLNDFYAPFNSRLAKLLKDDRFIWK